MFYIIITFQNKDINMKNKFPGINPGNYKMITPDSIRL